MKRFSFIPFGSLLLCAAALPASGGEKAPVGMVQALVMEQTALGLPDGQPDVSTRQKLILEVDGNRLVLVSYRDQDRKTAPDGPSGKDSEGKAREEGAPPVVDRTIILHLDHDPPDIYEIWDQRDQDGCTYRHTQQDLNKIQEDRDKAEARWLRHLGSYSTEDQKVILGENHLRRDGKRIIEVKHSTGREILGHSCDEVVVLENGRPVIRAQITRGVAGGKNFFQLYQKLGAFSREVLEAVAELEGVPLEAEITVVTAIPAYTISARCLSVKIMEVPESTFEVPPDCKERETELPAIVPCVQCKKEFERDHSHRLITETGLRLFFDTEACKNKYLENH